MATSPAPLPGAPQLAGRVDCTHQRVSQGSPVSEQGSTAGRTYTNLVQVEQQPLHGGADGGIWQRPSESVG